MTPGQLIEFSSGDDRRIGVIVGEVGNNKLEVVTAEGDQMRATRDEVTFETGVDSSDYGSSEAARAAAGGFAHRVAEAVADIDVPMLWEFVSDIGEPMGPEELAELFFDSTRPAAVLAIERVLGDDYVYFKQKKGPVFEPRPDAQVAELKQQRAAELEKGRQRQAFIEGVGDILAADGEARIQLADQKMADPEFRRLARELQKYAIYDRDHDRAEQAKELLGAIEDHIDGYLTGRYGAKAFHLMVDMTVWDEHENLHLLRHNVSTDIDEDIIAAAEGVAKRGWTPESFRRDLSDVLTFSIDAASTRDIDDALSCEALEEGGWRVGVHIADPSAWVDQASPVDLEARGRATSVYLPRQTYPMFPHNLSHDKMSLVADQLRPAMSTLLTFDDEFELVDTEIAVSTVRVDHRLTYQQVDRLLAGAESGEVSDAVNVLDDIAEASTNRRIEGGAVSIDLPDLELQVDYEPGGQPRVECEVLDASSPARQLVSELMISNNRVLGEFCRDQDLPTIYRGQSPPEQELYTDDVMAVPEGLAREFAVVRKMKPGDTTTQPAAHFGLGLAVYVQASSPIRRYTDLVAQRQIKARLAGQPLPFDADDIMEVLGSVESAASGAYYAQRDTARYWTIYYLGARREQPLEATVVEHKGHDESLAAVFVHEVALKTNAKFRDRPPVGEVCEVVVQKADPREDVLHLRQADR